MSRYIWCEDKGSGYQFWKELFGTLYPDIIVETKENNTRLRQAAQHIKDDNNTYYILMDTAIDNPDVLREVIALHRVIEGKSNIRTISINSFEFVLLSFEMLEDWIFAQNDELKVKRKDLLELRKQLVKLVLTGGEAKDLSKLKELLGYPNKYSSERIAAKMLFEITRNTGFQTDKSSIGPCFIISCCDWKNRQSDDICGLDNSRITHEEKKKLLVNHSVLNAALTGVGL